MPKNKTSEVTAENEPRPRAIRRLPVIIFSIVCPILVMESLARFIVAVGDPSQYGSFEFDTRLQLAQNPPRDRPYLLILGDSIASRGAYSELLARRLQATGLPLGVLNLACDGAFPRDEIILARTAVKNGLKLYAVIFDVNGVCLFNPVADYDNDYSPRFWKSPEGARIAESEEARGFKKQVSYQIKRLLRGFYLYRYSGYLKEQLQHFTQALVAPFSTHDSKFDPDRRAISKEGFAPGFHIASNDELQKDEQFHTEFIANFKNARHKIAYGYAGLKPIKEFSETNHVPLILVHFPAPLQSISAVFRACGLTESQVIERLRQVADETNCRFLNLSRICAPGDFSDCTHVNVIGAIKTTEALGRELPVLLPQK
ncbi:MAG TPA: hypothetical protein V6C72_05225 [Chroococcales cyanobacterium]